MFFLRLAVGILLLAILAIAAIPLLVLIDLSGGGTGFGLCPDGIGSCATPLTAGPELTLILAVVLFVLVASVRLLLRMVRRLEVRQPVRLNGQR